MNKYKWNLKKLEEYYGNTHAPLNNTPFEFKKLVIDSYDEDSFLDDNFKLSDLDICFVDNINFKAEDDHLLQFVFRFNLETNRLERLHIKDDWDFNNWTGKIPKFCYMSGFCINWGGETSEQLEELFWIFNHYEYCDEADKIPNSFFNI